ncbi:hypothetical protein [Bacillus rhizoplanae]|uniref:hypothetical protein n=1 Tax=Bacillus rhizoplanae TaxID=2880966 RepID=UPI003D19CC45
MRITLVSFLHFIIWSGFSIVLLLSDRDKLHYKVLLFFVFFYLAYVIAHIMLHSRKEAFFFTVANSMLFFISKLFFFTG